VPRHEQGGEPSAPLVDVVQVLVEVFAPQVGGEVLVVENPYTLLTQRVSDGTDEEPVLTRER
jgi:hypothetical protein